jgi:hypothetical protein
VCLLAALLGCSTPPTRAAGADGSPTGEPTPSVTPRRDPGVPPSAAPAGSGAAAVADAGARDPDGGLDGGADGRALASSTPPAVEPAAAAKILFLDAADTEAASCSAGSDAATRIRCLIARRYQGDAKAAELALALYEHTGDVAGVEPEQLFDGGWRGTIKLVPELPVGPYRRHLAWVAGACDDFEAFSGALSSHASRPLRYRTRALGLRFLRSVGRTTPSAYAENWIVSYNVSGSLHSSADAVRETLFHEIFHLNDALHGQWSARVLPSLVDPVVTRCTRPGGRLDSACLAPFAPGTTMVRGSTYYAFHPGNGVWEYAAELAVRYYREQRLALGMREPPIRLPFKCGPAPNGRAWQLLVDEFFGGTDLTPACP